MRKFKTTFLFTLLLSIPLLTQANSEKKVFAFNNILFINSPSKGVLPRLTHNNYLYSSEKPWLNNNELYYPVIADLANQMSLKDAVDFEMQSAMKMGIDGFSFVYMISENYSFYQRFNEIIEAYFEVAEEKNYPFSFNITLKFEPTRQFSERIPDAQEVLNYFSTNKYSASKHWHKENGKKVIVFSKVKNLIEKEEFKKMEKQNDQIINFQPLFERINAVNASTGNQFNIIYTCIWPGRKKEIVDVGKHYDHIRIEALHMSNTALVERFSKLLEESNKVFAHSIYHEQISSYFVEKSTNKKRPNGFVKKHNLPIDQVYKEYDNLSLSKGLRLGFEQAQKYKAPILFLNSWNMFIEGNHIRPDYHHGYGLSELIKVLTQQWKGQEMDEAMFFIYRKKSLVDKKMLEYKVRKQYGDPNYGRDSIEIITSTKKVSALYVNNKLLKSVNPGLQVTTIPYQDGKINVALKREKNIIASITPLNEIRLLKNRSEPTVVYRSSHDQKYLEEMYDLLAQNEVSFYDMRFLLPHEKKEEWKAYEKERMSLFIKVLSLYEYDKSLFEVTNYKNTLKYEKKIGKLLSDEYYRVWKDLQREKLKYQKTAMKDFNIYDLNNSYNVLEME
ncbi:hypothetical protein [Flammeovirga aprica]|uniref:Uncharacterized protein n=1 Tax=Flammeovirga aprica JL-4 TaxID=694437 RepID=A0A7X9RXS0_9BACT|nr:hypothetical protein [Flammeovirga aprica]NME70625.1 hypothetical protein [Flammeovirga aprica JL-4]